VERAAMEREFGGTPRRRAELGERFQVGVRLSAKLKNRLDAAADLGGRSQSQEAELRIQHSFDRQDLLTDVLTIAYGGRQEIAELLKTIGTVVLVAGEALASNSRMRERLKTHWTSDPTVCDVAIEAAYVALETFRPAGAIPKAAGLGVRVANQVLGKKRGMSAADLSERLRETAERLAVKESPQEASIATDVIDLVERRRASG
jgi:hypothetical protein